MPDSPVEKQSPPDYPHEMETRVAILEHSTAELKYEIREVKAMVRDLTNTVLAKFDASDKAIATKFYATDKAIADLRVEVQSVRTELQTGLNSNLRWTVGSILGFGTLGLGIIGLLLKFH
ncbi:CCDC90 family protein [Acidiphilium sp. PA]|uniref:hypothetical protein n=1 Tax=Acidiphilium sp. PA TaxID=2871705 RepID=UPI002244A628|nr:hypothetical protein [Acidiphilium sp. PA]MCW8308941.1 CCDC90 family protein [Acidiphilium sp. PA]